MIQQITKADIVDIVGLCVGGALTAITDAYLSTTGKDGIGNLTLLNTLLDYSEPGVLEAFTDSEAVSRLERKLAKEGHPAGESMAGTFNILAWNDVKRPTCIVGAENDHIVPWKSAYATTRLRPPGPLCANQRRPYHRHRQTRPPPRDGT